MQIIVVSSDFRSKRTLSVGIPQVIGLGFAGLVALALTATLANYLSLKYAATSNHPLIRGILLADQHAEAKQRQQQIQDNINSLAVKLGEMQAHMLRLDGLGEKLAKVAGLKPQELPSATANAGRGGAATAGAPLSIDCPRPTLAERQQLSVWLACERERDHPLVDAGVARSRSEALAWAVTLVGEHTQDWLDQLRTAMTEVDRVRQEGPGL